MQLAPQTYLQGGKYMIIEKVGQGGFGIVYQALHLVLRTEVCIKEFFYSEYCERASNALDVTINSKSAEKINLVNSFKKKFLKEAQRLAKFQHPNIVQVTDNFEENNTAYFVMEYLQGGSLEDLLSREGALSEQKALQILLPIIDAMQSVHEDNLLHLDIKPTNIMLRKDQSPVLIDFGISKYLENTTGHVNTKTTSPVGVSKGYAPWEQYGGSISDCSKATDVYSLCATAYKMVTSQTPPEPLQMFSFGFKSPKELSPEISNTFNSAIIKGMATKAADRQQSMLMLKTSIDNTIQFKIQEKNHEIDVEEGIQILMELEKNRKIDESKRLAEEQRSVELEKQRLLEEAERELASSRKQKFIILIAVTIGLFVVMFNIPEDGPKSPITLKTIGTGVAIFSIILFFGYDIIYHSKH